MNPLFRQLVAAVGVVCLPAWVSACDICGCSGGGSSLGLLPLVPRHFVGFRWQTQGFRTLAHGTESGSAEHFQTLDLWGRWQPSRRWQIIGSVPMIFNSRRFDNGKSLKINDLGDVSLLAQFALLDPARQATRRWQHTLQLGGGLKLPTGTTTRRDPLAENQTLAPGLQPGTGSWDWLASVLYALQRGQVGASLDASVRLPGANTEGYQLGNRLSANFRAFFSQKLGKTSLAPYVGAALDARDADRQNSIWQNGTGGWAAFGTLGLEVFRGDVAVSLGWQLPVAGDLSDGQVASKSRASASVVWLFGGKSRAGQLAVPTVFPAVPAPSSSRKN